LSTMPRKDGDRQTANQHRQTAYANAKMIKNFLAIIYDQSAIHRFALENHQFQHQSTHNLTILHMWLKGSP
ncbi:hypothetical protein HAX54_029851, partial [Datura stramonium]|nr:hypothetical protein [Datura stramonium]